jgi:cytochrome c biogenesis protein CcdA/thiol-disulfide isomerase/thioredoxin
MLPAYLSYFMGSDAGGDTRSRSASLHRAFVVGGVMSAAFLFIFGAAGLAITLGFRTVIDWIPWLALVVGVGVAALGVAMVFGYELTVGLPKVKRASTEHGLRSVFVFGASYGLASLSCTLPVFLSVVATQLTASSFAGGVATFVAYGAGMSMMLMTITLVIALGKQTIVNRLRASIRYVNRIAGGILVLAGSYIVWFWGTTLTAGPGALNDSTPFRFFETLSQRATEIFGENALLWAAAFGVIIGGAAVWVLWQDRQDSSEENARVIRRRIVGAGSIAAVVIMAAAAFALGNTLAGSDAAAMPANEEPGTTATSTAVPQGDPVSSVAVVDFDGNTVSLDEYAGRPVVVNFWASWCPSCVAELSAAIRPSQDRFGDQVTFVGVNLQDDRAAAAELIEETGVAFDLLEDADGTLYTDFGAIGMPFTALITADGIVVDEHNGPLTEDQLNDKIAQYLLTER